MAVSDELRLKVSADEYLRRIAALDGKINEIDGVLAEYETLKNDSVKILGEGDTNLNQLRSSIEQNIKAVQGERKLLEENRNMLQRQMDNLESLTTNVGSMFKETAEAAKQAFRTIKAVSDFTG